jgi:DNA-binding response OmpR family regulator
MEHVKLSGIKILIVEDEESLAVGLEYNLNEEGYETIIAKNGKEALEIFENNKFDLIVLDIMLPFYDGFEITEIVRKKNPQIPILMLTAKTKNEDKLKGLELGVDDYLTKPFHLDELLLRIKGMLKRKAWYKNIDQNNSVYNIGSNKINFHNLTFTKEEKVYQLTHSEIMILKYLIDKKGKIVSRKELLENVWNVSPEVETRTIDIFISRLRKHLEPDPQNPKYIKSVRGIGYIFNE